MDLIVRTLKCNKEGEGSDQNLEGKRYVRLLSGLIPNKAERRKMLFVCNILVSWKMSWKSCWQPGKSLDGQVAGRGRMDVLGTWRQATADNLAL